jgi:hypothetical protein
MSEILDRPTSVLPSRFGYLMALYAENYTRLARVFAPHRLVSGHYVSDPGEDGFEVHMHVLEKHRYTLELDLSYGFVDERTGLPTPSAQVRVYTDARQAEAWHCEPGRHLWQVLGPFPEAHTVMQHRLRMNSFLNRWLEYLGEQGHSIGTLERIDEPVRVRCG